LYYCIYCTNPAVAAPPQVIDWLHDCVVSHVAAAVTQNPPFSSSSISIIISIIFFFVFFINQHLPHLVGGG